MGRELPSGTVTLLFTDVEGSTRLLTELGAEAYEGVLVEHRRLLREAFVLRGGVEVDTQGDAFFFAFSSAVEAVEAAGKGQQALSDGPIRVRMGLHAGRPRVGREGYVGEEVHLAARIAAAAHGGQVVLSRDTRALLDDRFSLLDLGEHRLKDFEEPVWLYQLGTVPFPPLRTIANTNLPRPASSFVGRAHELADLVDLLRRNRFVTLTGPGGSGKTRLAIEAAAELLPEQRNGVFWVGLATVRDPELVAPTIAQAIGAQQELGKDIGEKALLLLLDNLEQVVEAAPTLAALVERCPNPRLLVTSRELLRVRGEVEYELLPLAAREAVALFAMRAQLEPSAAIEELCRRLDNMPLAVELAAARAKALTPEQIVERLAQRLDLLRGGRDADPRQRTLRATIAWSHDLLSADERQLFARLGIFAGGCRLDAAEAVVEADVDMLQSLVEKSLLRQTDGRFWMLETIREYAVERLEESGEAEAIYRRHARFFFALAESTCLSVERIGDGEMRYDLASAEQANLRAAIDWAQETDPELGLRIAVELEQFWISVNPSEGRRRFAALLDRVGEMPPDLRAAALRCFGGMSQVSGEKQQGEQLYEASLALYERLGDEWGIIHLQNRLASIAINFEDWKRARSLLEANLTHARARGSTYLEAEALGFLAIVEDQDGNTEQALPLLRRYVELCREIGFTWFEAIGSYNLAEITLRLGRTEEASEHARTSLELCRSMGEQRITVYALAVLAVAARRQGDSARAGQLWGAIEAQKARASFPLEDEELDGLEKQVLSKPNPELESALGTGRRLSLDQAIEYALDDRP